MQKEKTVKTKLALSVSIIALLTIVIAALSINKNHADVCSETYVNNVTVSAGGTSFRAERLETESERVKGLSGKKCIPNDVAMLFVFDKPDTYGFWMKDMNFSIDMVWLDGDKKVVYIQKNATPESYPQIFKPTKNALYVLEVASGTAEKLSLKEGDQLNF